MTNTIDFEKIAARIHQFYCDLAERENWPNDFPMPFDELPEFMKADNTAAARRIGQVLSLAGLRLVPRNGRPWTDEERQEMQNLIEQDGYLDLLAEGEHEGWIQARLRQGWRPGPSRDIPRREHDLLVPWSQFREQVERRQEQERQAGHPPRKSIEEEVESQKNRDRKSVRNYVTIIAQTEYRIVRED